MLVAGKVLGEDATNGAAASPVFVVAAREDQGREREREESLFVFARRERRVKRRKRGSSSPSREEWGRRVVSGAEIDLSYRRAITSTLNIGIERLDDGYMRRNTLTFWRSWSIIDRNLIYYILY